MFLETLNNDDIVIVYLLENDLHRVGKISKVTKEVIKIDPITETEEKALSFRNPTTKRFGESAFSTMYEPSISIKFPTVLSIPSIREVVILSYGKTTKSNTEG